MTNENVKGRDYYFDNLKALLIFLVVLGHFLLSMYYVSSFSKVAVTFIYVFHMPLFVFVTGYFSKNSKKNPFIWFFIPYLIFSTVYGMISLNSFFVNPLIPTFAYWYLLSMVFWKLGSGKLSEIKWVIPITICASLVINVMPGLSNFLSISRTITYLPFFMIGYNFKREWINKIKNIPFVFIIILIIFGVILFVFGIKNDFVNYNLLLRNISFDGLCISRIHGLIANVFFIFPLTVIFSVVILYFISEKKNAFSYIGKNTIIVFLLHPFICYCFPFFVNQLNSLCEFSLGMHLTLKILMSLLVTIVLGFNLFTKVYNKIMIKIEHILIKDNSKT